MSFNAPQGSASSLEVKIVGGLLNISIGVGHLIDLVEADLEYRTGYEETKIIDAKLFAHDIAAELSYEEDDGSTSVHRAIFEAARQAINNGSGAVEENQ